MNFKNIVLFLCIAVLANAAPKSVTKSAPKSASKSAPKSARTQTPAPAPVCVPAPVAENTATIAFNTVFSDSTGKLSFTYPVALPNQAALQELQRSFIRQKFGESFLEQEPAAILSLFISQNKEISHISDAVSFPFPGIVQFATSYYAYPPGGAHGINGFDIGIYTFADGKRIELSSIFNKDWEKDVTKLIIKEFLLSQNLQSLIDYDYTQKESDFMPRIVRLGGDGLEFVFPVYQIAPYGAGVQNVFLSWNSLKPYLNKKSVIYKRLQF
ncbi:MAG: hypothetical protein LBQ87_03055 [Candidatus Fibromonas sp.]|jgi:hypothetical protein|nr:hypothetical protein [Candidatus Fibromonas sp.]